MLLSKKIILLFIRRNYHSLRHMHVRGERDSHQIVRQPLTTAQESKNSSRNFHGNSSVFSRLVEERWPVECQWTMDTRETSCSCSIRNDQVWPSMFYSSISIVWSCRFVDDMILSHHGFRYFWFIETHTKQRKTMKYWLLHKIHSHFRWVLLKIDWGLVGLVNWFNGNENLCESPRVCGIRLFNEISNLPSADDQRFTFEIGVWDIWLVNEGKSLGSDVANGSNRSSGVWTLNKSHWCLKEIKNRTYGDIASWNCPNSISFDVSMISSPNKSTMGLSILST